MPDIPNTRFYNFVDTLADVHYSPFGQAQVQLDPKSGAVIDVSEFRKAHIRIGSTAASKFEVFFGKIAGPTLAARYSGTIDSKIHTFKINGPEMVLWLMGGQPNSKEQVQLWVFLQS